MFNSGITMQFFPKDLKEYKDIVKDLDNNKEMENLYSTYLYTVRKLLKRNLDFIYKEENVNIDIYNISEENINVFFTKVLENKKEHSECVINVSLDKDKRMFILTTGDKQTKEVPMFIDEDVYDTDTLNIIMSIDELCYQVIKTIMQN